jgi:hypothetical protein
MTLETENYWQSYEHWKSGDTIFKDLDIQLLSYLIMIISSTSSFHKLLDNEWLNGPYICLNSISNWFIFQEKRTYKPTYYHNDQIYVCPQGIDNEDVIILPEHLFVNLINMKLQKKIVNAKNMDYDAAKTIKKLLKQGPKEAKKDLVDGKWKNLKEKTYCFTRGRTMCQLMQNSEKKLFEDTTIIRQQDIQENSKHLMQSENITGGQNFKSLSKTMSKDVEHVNSSKLTEIQQNQHSCL